MYFSMIVTINSDYIPKQQHYSVELCVFTVRYKLNFQSYFHEREVSKGLSRKAWRPVDIAPLVLWHKELVCSVAYCFICSHIM
jgi:hypothetical protein